MEIDGEPFLLKPCELKIKRKNQIQMIAMERSQVARQTRKPIEQV